MKFKKAAALTMAAAMTLGVTGGMPVSADDDIYEVVVQFPTLGTTPSDLQKVEDAINERTESEIGVHVTFYPVSAFETNNTTSLMVSSGEKLDLAISIFEGGVANYARFLLLFRPEREMPSTVSQQTEVRIRFIPTSITPISWEPAMHPAF